MKAKRILTTGFITLAVLTLGVMIPVLGFGKGYVMAGNITAIDLDHQTVVIEVPLASKMFTVAGPLASDAKLSKKMKTADLDDFMVGERVTVRWHSTSSGHVIDGLAAR